MEINTVIEVQGFADFDVIYTDCIMVSAEKLNVNEIRKTFCSLNGLPENGKGLPINMLYDTTTEFISYLEKNGFTKLNTNKILFCD